MKQHVTVPSELGYEYQDHFLSSADGTRLHAWQIKPKGPAIGTILFLHGNAENISTHFKAVLWLVDKGYRVFALDYRGYGLSQGKPDLPEVYDDINAATIWIDKNYRASGKPTSHPVYLLGQSLGASLAIKYASVNSNFNEQFDALIVEAAFARFGSIAKHVASRHWLTWGAQYPAQWLLSDRFDPLDAIAKLEDTPLLLIHSRDDQIIPYHFGESLYKAANTPKRFITTQGAHIRAFAQADVRAQLLDFLQQYSHAANPK
ncbi:MAG: alpha/beta hydrolase [Granulosicoccus sp.]